MLSTSFLKINGVPTFVAKSKDDTLKLLRFLSSIEPHKRPSGTLRVMEEHGTGIAVYSDAAFERLNPTMFSSPKYPIGFYVRVENILSYQFINFPKSA